MWSCINRNLLHPLLAKKHGSRHLEYSKIVEKSQHDPREVIEARQWAAVRRLLKHAYTTVPYYRELFDQIGVIPSDFRSIEDLSWLPVLTKKEIRLQRDRLLSSAFGKSKLFRKTTSGSTGVPLEIYVDRFAKEWKAACTLRSDQWSGWKLGERVAKVWGNPEYQNQGWKGKFRNLLIDRATYLDTIGLDESALANFATELNRNPPSLLFGHAHSLYLFAQYCDRNKIMEIQPKGIISTAMPLHQFQRNLMEKVFNCAVTNRYGCEEVSLIASQCEQHQDLHVNSDSILAQTLQDSQRSDLPSTGNLVLTDLVNFAMPLIRYQVGDVVTHSTNSCPCGRGLPTISRVEGREADYVLTPDGKMISGISLTENFAMKISGIEQLQIIQPSIRELTLLIVPGSQFSSASRNEIDSLTTSLFGPDVRSEVELVDAIHQDPSGKYRFCISMISNSPPNETMRN
jgi:phenylacetate-CoA ligase